MSSEDAAQVRAVLERAYRDDGATLAWLTRHCGGDLGLAEDALQDAVTAALSAWQASGIPDVPAAWLRTTARRKAVDRARRAATGQKKLALLNALERREREGGAAVVDEPTGDDQLTLIFTCCHPALGTEAQVALALRAVCGLTTPEIASAFLVAESTMAQRLVRAKNKIAGAGIPFRTPPPPEMPARLASVLGVVYLVFNEGYMASAGDELIRTDLCAEAIRLARLLAELMPDEAEVSGLLALLLFQHSRRAARTDRAGILVRLEDQDRAAWDVGQIDEGAALLAGALRRGEPGPYVLQAAIASCHATAPTPETTDWARIRALYDRLLAQTQSPVVALNRIVAVAREAGAQEALDALDDLADAAPVVEGWHRFHLTRAETRREQNDVAGARDAYVAALALDPPPVERQHIEQRLGSLQECP